MAKKPACDLLDDGPERVGDHVDQSFGSDQVILFPEVSRQNTEGAVALLTKLDERYLALKGVLEARLEKDSCEDGISVGIRVSKSATPA